MFYDAEIDSVITLIIQTDNVQSACHCDSDLSQYFLLYEVCRIGNKTFQSLIKKYYSLTLYILYC